ncbi:hypothetical Protein YC6258_05359 [Gynuella sunshinyii YC6258]|uniref:Uncharacterized protein n=1 Tax=Gynuella sunshinyii YC6258 TaxID=1445510 RepID=A0A0C5VDH9_9GAMM|nr:hypothetical Protein YC6258_05359 [Gynuella sunshinyii YC6258]
MPNIESSWCHQLNALCFVFPRENRGFHRGKSWPEDLLAGHI